MNALCVINGENYMCALSLGITENYMRTLRVIISEYYIHGAMCRYH